jgi:pre-mRNA-splicing helicase BRR2
VATFCNRYPSLEVAHELAGGGALAVGAAAELNVTLEREMDAEEALGPVDAPRFPKARLVVVVMVVVVVVVADSGSQRKEEGWWAVLGNPEANQLLAIKRVNLQRAAKVKLDFTPPDSGAPLFVTPC